MRKLRNGELELMNYKWQRQDLNSGNLPQYHRVSHYTTFTHIHDSPISTIHLKKGVWILYSTFLLSKRLITSFSH